MATKHTETCTATPVAVAIGIAVHVVAIGVAVHVVAIGVAVHVVAIGVAVAYPVATRTNGMPRSLVPTCHLLYASSADPLGTSCTILGGIAFTGTRSTGKKVVAARDLWLQTTVTASQHR
jgi:hypothetical protein